jgi:hypothetical protein
MSITNKEIMSLKEEIENIKDYIESDLCKVCEEMKNRLSKYEELLQTYLN